MDTIFVGLSPRIIRIISSQTTLAALILVNFSKMMKMQMGKKCYYTPSSFNLSFYRFRTNFPSLFHCNSYSYSVDTVLERKMLLSGIKNTWDKKRQIKYRQTVNYRQFSKSIKVEVVSKMTDFGDQQ